MSPGEPRAKGRLRRLEAPAGEPLRSDDALARAADALREGAVLVHPTSTVYGLGAITAAGDEAIARLKRREPGHPFLRLAADVASLRAAHPGLAWDERAGRLAARFWPGGLTVVLPDGPGRTLGVRVEAYPVTRALLEQLGPVTMSSTSVNASGEPAARTAAEVTAFLDAAPSPSRPVVFLDAGDLPPSRPSTVVSLVDRPGRLLRAGAVPVADIEAALGAELDR